MARHAHWRHRAWCDRRRSRLAAPRAPGRLSRRRAAGASLSLSAGAAGAGAGGERPSRALHRAARRPAEHAPRGRVALLAARDVHRLSRPRRHPVPDLQPAHLADDAACPRARRHRAKLARAVPVQRRHGVLDEAARAARRRGGFRRGRVRALPQADGAPAPLDLRRLDLRLAVDDGGPRRPGPDRARTLRRADGAGDVRNVGRQLATDGLVRLGAGISLRAGAGAGAFQARAPARRGGAGRGAARDRARRAAPSPRGGAERARPARRGRDVPVRRLLELARPLRLGGHAAAARVGRPHRLPRPDELLGAAGLLRPASHGARARRPARPAQAVAVRGGGGAGRVDLVRRLVVARACCRATAASATRRAR